jgi:hypothetical protein
MLNRLGNSGRNNLSGTHFVVVATHSQKRAWCRGFTAQGLSVDFLSQKLTLQDS